METRKISVFVLFISSLLSGAAAFSQVENDDLYFTSKDREELRAQRASQPAYASNKKTVKKEVMTEEENINPTDSYSARNVNPEFEARSYAQGAAVDQGDYFVNNYQARTVRNYNNWNNDFNTWYGSSWYHPNYYNSSIFGWNSPYYGMYNPYNNPWNNPYFQSGWSSSFSYHWGNNWNYGWGSGFNYGYPGWGSSLFFNSWNSPYSYWGNNYYNGYYNGYPNVVIIERDGRNYHSYGRRATRGSDLGIDYSRGNTGGRTSGSSYNPNAGSGGRTATGGRVTSTNENNNSGKTEYYNRSWRTNQSRGTNGNQSYSSGSNENSNSSGRTSSYSNENRSWNNTNSNSNSNSSYNRSRSESSTPSYTPSRSSSSSSGGGSYGGGNSGSSGSSPSRSRGR